MPLTQPFPDVIALDLLVTLRQQVPVAVEDGQPATVAHVAGHQTNSSAGAVPIRAMCIVAWEQIEGERPVGQRDRPLIVDSDLHGSA